ncbi:MAG: glycosyltransferase family 9 protein [Candidatus Krumholzibacteria bacterium]|nr:glycosyltransferase family 9 protein [Candidatus Krumholzibacteria bacterium]
MESLRTGDIRKILIVRFHSLGDIALSIPIIHSLRRRFPEAGISYLCFSRYAEALKGVGEIDDVITMEGDVAGMISAVRRLRKEKFDLALDLLSSPGSGPVTWLSGASLRIGMDTGRHNWCYSHVLPRGSASGGRSAARYTMDANREIPLLLGLEEGRPDGGTERCERVRNYDIGFPPALAEESWAEKYFNGLGDPGRGFAGLVPGSKCRLKSWPEENFARLAGMLDDEGFRPLVLWGPGEEGAADRITASAPAAVKVPPMGIARLGAVIKRLAVLAGIDSGPKHVAVMQGIPTVTLFGPTDPRVWDPMTERHRVIFRNLPCSPCGCGKCAANVCMSGITPGEVIEEIRLAVR